MVAMLPYATRRESCRHFDFAVTIAATICRRVAFTPLPDEEYASFCRHCRCCPPLSMPPL